MKPILRIATGVAACGMLHVASVGYAGITQTNAVSGDGWTNAWWNVLYYTASNDLINSGQSTLSSVTASNNKVIGGNAAAINDGTAAGGFFATGTYCYATSSVAITFTFNTSVNTGGYDITDIKTYAAWNTSAGINQHYAITYTTVDDPTVKNLYEVNYVPGSAITNGRATGVYLKSNTVEPMASHVNSMTFSVYAPDGISAVFREVDIFGAASSPIPESASLGIVALGASALLARKPRK